MMKKDIIDYGKWVLVATVVVLAAVASIYLIYSSVKI